jgi:hypothetical protein
MYVCAPERAVALSLLLVRSLSDPIQNALQLFNSSSGLRLVGTFKAFGISVFAGNSLGASVERRA